MSTHTVAYESLSNRSAANASIMPNHLTASHVASGTVAGSTGYLLPYPKVPPSGYNSVPIASGTIIEKGDSTIVTQAWADSHSVSQDGSYVDNGQAFFKPSDNETGFNSGRIAPRVLLDFSGAASPANSNEYEAHIHWGYRNGTNYQGIQHFCEFEDHPPDTNSDGKAKLAELLVGFNKSTNSYALGVDGSSNAIVANHCGFAGIAPEGAVYVRPEDLGNGPDQIPADVFDNAASKFRAHPSVFYPAGRAQYVRALTRQAVDTISIDAGNAGGPLGITNVNNPITSSDWLVSVDGQAMVVTLSHPNGSDYRRPRDIWNNVWVPIITGASGIIASVQFPSGDMNQGAVGYRWAYADYFRCLPLPGGNIIQSGAG